MPQYLLLERDENTLKEIFKGKFTKPTVDFLFTKTELADFQQESPLVITDPSASLATLQKLLEQHQGILITSNASEQALLSHLRNILIIRFDSGQKGLFRYYDPQIASYFYPSLEAKELSQWLGPIDKLEWLGATWLDKTNQAPQWQSITNPYPLTKDLLAVEKIYGLTEQNQQTLQLMQYEKIAYQWQQTATQNLNGLNISTVLDLVIEGAWNGFYEQKELEQYLNIRMQNPAKPVPTAWPTDDIEQRLIYLAQYQSQAIE